jgi:hypothetical protein
VRNLAVLAALAAVAWLVLARLRSSAPQAVIGYDDGSSLTLEPGRPELHRLVSAAEEALRA